MSGKAPAATDVRVPAVKSPGLYRGSGLHEVVPTNFGAKVAKSGNEALIGAQSGFRTSTGRQLFNIGGGEVGAHTAFAPKQQGRGYTHTKGQAQAHDELRDVAEEIIDDDIDDRDEVLNKITLGHLGVTPHGQAILGSPYLTGLLPNDDTSLGEVGKVKKKGKPDPQRLRIAQERHREREEVKRRGRTHKRVTGSKLKLSPSPPRTPIDQHGKGGDYIKKPKLKDEVEPFPFDPTAGEDYEYSAQVAAWLSQPQRFS
ncbi:hypothetical protein BH10PSE14_BH10PSE14_45260 [soil metagenome]